MASRARGGSLSHAKWKRGPVVILCVRHAEREKSWLRFDVSGSCFDAEWKVHQKRAPECKAKGIYSITRDRTLSIHPTGLSEVGVYRTQHT